jgi:ATP-dependent RNA helicase DDX3X
MRAQKEQLALGCDVLIATPGRLVDAMERGAVALGGVRYLVLDEADRILDQGFEPTVRRILFQSDLPRDEGLHTMMFSATFPSNVQILARDFMKHDYCRLRIGRYDLTSNVAPWLGLSNEHDQLILDLISIFILGLVGLHL